MKQIMTSAAALLALSACGQQEAPPVVEEVTAPPMVLGSGLNLDAMDTSVRPGDDFFAYMNGTWLKETEIPADKS
ncbi:MAG: peptidase M13, partial [Woeseiaceae bacterium]